MPVSRDRYDDVVDENHDLREAIDGLNNELNSARAVGRVAALAEEATTSEEFKGLVGEEADAAAAAIVVEKERERLVAEMSEKLQGERREEYTAEFRASEGPNIRKKLDEVFQSDGTYDDIEDNIRSTVHAEVQKDLLDEKHQQVRAELEAPENLAQIKASVMEGEEFKARVEELRNQTRGELETAWADKWWEEKQADVIQEEKDREKDYKAGRKLNDHGKTDIEKLRQSTRQELEGQWADEWFEDAKHAEVDDVTRAYIEERNKQTQAKLHKEKLTREMLETFETGGLDVSDITTGSKLRVYFGKYLPNSPREVKAQYGMKEVTKNVVQYDRYMRFSSLGEGRFIVEYDSLNEDGKSPYTQNDAIHTGTVVTIGRVKTENGHTELMPKLAQNVAMAYSTDTAETDKDNIVVTLSALANIEIDDISARGVDLYESV